MIGREDIVAEARSWVGTPVVHQGQFKGRATDCKGLIVGVGMALGLPEATTIAALTRNYSSGFRGGDLLAGLKESLRQVTEAEPGDVLAILFGRDPLPRHLAIFSRPGWIIHAYGGGVRKVSEVPIGPLRVHSRWTWPSLGEADG